MIDEDEVRAAVRHLADALAADGYELVVRAGTGAPTFVVTARSDSCEDCLVPRELMASMLIEELERANIPVERPLQLTYPGEAR